jgi:hypothetical protein
MKPSVTDVPHVKDPTSAPRLDPVERLVCYLHLCDSPSDVGLENGLAQIAKDSRVK